MMMMMMIPIASVCRPICSYQIRVRRTVTLPAFDFAYTDPVLDSDVSRDMEEERGIEFGITKVGGCLTNRQLQPERSSRCCTLLPVYHGILVVLKYSLQSTSVLRRSHLNFS